MMSIKRRAVIILTSHPAISSFVAGILVATLTIYDFIKGYFVYGVGHLTDLINIFYLIATPVSIGTALYLYGKKKRLKSHLDAFPTNNPNPIVEVDLAGNITYLNKTAKKLFPDLESKNPECEFLKEMESIIKKLKEEKSIFLIDEIECNENYYERTVILVSDEKRIHVYGKNINDQKLSEKQINRLVGFTEANPHPVFEVEYNGTISYANPAAIDLFSDLYEHNIQHPIFDNLESKIVDFKNGYNGLVVDEVCVNGNYYERVITGCDKHGHAHIYTTNITARKILEKKQIPLTLAMEENSNLIVLTDNKGKIEYVNHKFKLLTGYTDDEVCGKHIRMLKSDKVLSEQYYGIWKTLSSGDSWKGEFQNRKKSGDSFWVNASIIPVKDKKGEVAHYLAIEEETTQLKIEMERAEKAEKRADELYNLAIYDGLTELFNKRHFVEMAERSLSASSRYKEAIYAIMLDIDHFKSVNDTYGHHIGDEVLKGTAKKIKNNLRKSDIIGRYGGEEFSMLLSNCNHDAAYTIAEKLRNEVKNYVFETESGKLNITISLGLAKYDQEEHNCLGDLLKTADIALYKAKNSGRDRTIVFSQVAISNNTQTGEL